MKAKKNFSQNFLKDQLIIQELIHNIYPQNKDMILEIGPGLGSITYPMLDSGAQVLAIEVDTDMIRILQKKSHPHLTIHQGDILHFTLPIQEKKWRIVGNLPYHISSPILLWIYNARQNIQDAHVMLQEEVVDRLVSLPGNRCYGRLSVLMQWAFELHKICTIPATAFNPAPQVQSAFLQLQPRVTPQIVNPDQLQYITHYAFQQRRKTLRNALKPILDMTHTDLSHWANRRAEELSYQDYVWLTNWYEENIHKKTMSY